MEKKRKHSQPHLTDQEVLEYCVQNFTHSRLLIRQFKSVREEILDIWKRTLAAIFLVGPFVMIIPFITWFGLIPPLYLSIPLGINAAISVCISSLYHLIFVRIEATHSGGQEQLVHFLNTWYFSMLGWLGLWSSLMVLVGSIGCLIRLPGSLWWIPVLIYGVGGIGIWVGRRGILRAIVEGPEAHPWFRPIRLFFATSVGFWIFLTAVQRIFFGWLENVNVNLAFLLFAAWVLSLSLLVLGLSLIGVVIGRLHYQRWKGVDELRA